jgi:long-chain acyl-CoA synthetase
VRPAGTSATSAEVLDGDGVPHTAAGPDTPAVVLYTSGVSGLPKPVVLTHANLAATSDGLVNGPGAQLDAGTVAFHGLPLSHVFGLNSLMGTVLSAGGTLVLADGVEPERVAEIVARHRVTALSAVPLQGKALASLGSRELFATVNRATWSAAPMPPTLVAAVEERLGLRLAGGFGLTESSGTVLQDDPRAPHTGTVGRPLGQTEVRIVDDGEEALPGDFGELWLRGPSVVRSYLDGSPTEVDDEGWLRTGDVAVLDDDGRVAIVDRSKDVINVSGFNVSPAEVEEALASHPAVAASAVVGDLEDDHEVVVAHVVARPGAHPTEAELVEHCRAQLSRYKVPRRIHRHDELPLTESGKAGRRLLGTA